MKSSFQVQPAARGQGRGQSHQKEGEGGVKGDAGRGRGGSGRGGRAPLRSQKTSDLQANPPRKNAIFGMADRNEQKKEAFNSNGSEPFYWEFEAVRQEAYSIRSADRRNQARRWEDLTENEKAAAEEILKKQSDMAERDRIDLILDPDAPVLPLAEHEEILAETSRVMDKFGDVCGCLNYSLALRLLLHVRCLAHTQKLRWTYQYRGTAWSSRTAELRKEAEVTKMLHILRKPKELRSHEDVSFLAKAMGRFEIFERLEITKSKALMENIALYASVVRVSVPGGVRLWKKGDPCTWLHLLLQGEAFEVEETNADDPDPAAESSDEEKLEDGRLSRSFFGGSSSSPLQLDPKKLYLKTKSGLQLTERTNAAPTRHGSRKPTLTAASIGVLPPPPTQTLGKSGGGNQLGAISPPRSRANSRASSITGGHFTTMNKFFEFQDIAGEEALLSPEGTERMNAAWVSHKAAGDPLHAPNYSQYTVPFEALLAGSTDAEKKNSNDLQGGTGTSGRRVSLAQRRASAGNMTQRRGSVVAVQRRGSTVGVNESSGGGRRKETPQTTQGPGSIDSEEVVLLLITKGAALVTASRDSPLWLVSMMQRLPSVPEEHPLNGLRFVFDRKADNSNHPATFINPSELQAAVAWLQSKQQKGPTTGLVSPLGREGDDVQECGGEHTEERGSKGVWEKSNKGDIGPSDWRFTRDDRERLKLRRARGYSCLLPGLPGWMRRFVLEREDEELQATRDYLAELEDFRRRVGKTSACVAAAAGGGSGGQNEKVTAMGRRGMQQLKEREERHVVVAGQGVWIGVPALFGLPPPYSVSGLLLRFGKLLSSEQVLSPLFFFRKWLNFECELQTRFGVRLRNAVSLKEALRQETRFSLLHRDIQRIKKRHKERDERAGLLHPKNPLDRKMPGAETTADVRFTEGKDNRSKRAAEHASAFASLQEKVAKGALRSVYWGDATFRDRHLPVPLKIDPKFFPAPMPLDPSSELFALLKKKKRKKQKTKTSDEAGPEDKIFSRAPSSILPSPLRPATSPPASPLFLPDQPTTQILSPSSLCRPRKESLSLQLLPKSVSLPEATFPFPFPSVSKMEENIAAKKRTTKTKGTSEKKEKPEEEEDEERRQSGGRRYPFPEFPGQLRPVSPFRPPPPPSIHPSLGLTSDALALFNDTKQSAEVSLDSDAIATLRQRRLSVDLFISILSRKLRHAPLEFQNFVHAHGPLPLAFDPAPLRALSPVRERTDATTGEKPMEEKDLREKISLPMQAMASRGSARPPSPSSPSPSTKPGFSRADSRMSTFTARAGQQQQDESPTGTNNAGGDISGRRATIRGNSFFHRRRSTVGAKDNHTSPTAQRGSTKLIVDPVTLAHAERLGGTLFGSGSSLQSNDDLTTLQRTWRERPTNGWEVDERMRAQEGKGKGLNRYGMNGLLSKADPTAVFRPDDVISYPTEMVPDAAFKKDWRATHRAQQRRRLIFSRVPLPPARGASRVFREEGKAEDAERKELDEKEGEKEEEEEVVEDAGVEEDEEAEELLTVREIDSYFEQSFKTFWTRMCKEALEEARLLREEMEEFKKLRPGEERGDSESDFEVWDGTDPIQDDGEESEEDEASEEGEAEGEQDEEQENAKSEQKPEQEKEDRV
uniref:Uncharacterized protein n=1 Tax=Chromera velia CCMP2878 TaxID=1169474 RepID=A0A0G4GVP4_9ALVE|eukprot:Cvel_5288.t1-p1 / transcript=Cvel_5288.t1 / gene=Cvel_5288 / organism=Chromera_velia_CCMP2878 / gene_product=hypothetical protein / transcript_product=hypothetical protein / location=Cvel_scaffold244:71613-82847(-) / protein_length=1629 / sequence_SO=supercontig / SO=protein_coding / is_pseudo=false